ncbi:succinate dehydrogenase, cytochrome b556 subunit [Pseudoroseicyclus aestuarii]|uniref:Succinate dehydrogenase cytochrome b556 subunit n=1 Tax=Pseudoroseicyclus aestuarii TaxID=1795041 RepID=A0A318SY44_9RHOB|nr:succinate dehydrogenase, cytochrome b556 subunit [Pseudoroseicyclus aestuarii]PYE84757.1 succinate dehydrogenase subunit C [Pseudoroseicyclus aestuarii]
MADIPRGNRPLSPYMLGPYYRIQLTSLTSILTRITGNALIVTTALIAWWFAALVSGPEAYATANGVITSWFGDLVMTLSLLGLWYHTLAGIRHLIWDNLAMLEVPKAEMLGWACLGGSVVLTLLTIIIL